MAKHWREPLDVARHLDHGLAGGPRLRAAEPGGEAFFVEVCRFTFELASLTQLEACLAFFEARLRPSARIGVCQLETGHWQRWHERFPARILKGSKRERIARALRAALSDFRRAP